MRKAAEIPALHGHAPGALGAEREHSGPRRVERGLGQTLVRIDLVEPTVAEIVDDRARHEGDIAKIPRADAVVLEPGRDRRDSFLAVGRAPREYDGVGEGPAVAEPQRIGVHGAGRAAAHIDHDRRLLGKPDDRETGRPLLVGADADLDRRPIECQGGTVDRRVGNEVALVGVRRRNGPDRDGPRRSHDHGQRPDRRHPVSPQASHDRLHDGQERSTQRPPPSTPTTAASGASQTSRA